MTQLRTVAIAAGTGRVPAQLFQSLVLTAPGREVGRKSATFAVSIALHATLAVALVILPLLLGNALPSVGSDTIFTAPVVEIRLLPPPPAAPGGGTKLTRPPREVAPQASGFVAPIDVSSEIKPDDIFAELDGDRDGVDGGVFDLRRDRNEVGSVVHVPDEAPPVPARVVRISQFAAPKPDVHVPPRYPRLAIDAGLSGVVVIEAEVDTAGRVKTAKVLRGHPLLNDAALEAVTHWRYRPLLLNGEPTGFILNVTVEFNLRRG